MLMVQLLALHCRLLALKAAAKGAMESAINALPASATEADKVCSRKVAVKAIDAYKELGGTVSATLNTKSDECS